MSQYFQVKTLHIDIINLTQIEIYSNVGFVLCQEFEISQFSQPESVECHPFNICHTDDWLHISLELKCPQNGFNASPEYQMVSRE
jgi:hypothetical protein